MGPTRNCLVLDDDLCDSLGLRVWNNHVIYKALKEAVRLKVRDEILGWVKAPHHEGVTACGGICCDVVTSPLCNRDELLTPRVRMLVDAQLQREIPFILKLRLERALVGESLPD